MATLSYFFIEWQRLEFRNGDFENFLVVKEDEGLYFKEWQHRVTFLANGNDCRFEMWTLLC